MGPLKYKKLYLYLTNKEKKLYISIKISRPHSSVGRARPW